MKLKLPPSPKPVATLPFEK